MKRTIAFLLSAAMTVSLLAGCGGKGNTSTQQPSGGGTSTQQPSGGGTSAQQPSGGSSAEKEWYGTADGKTVTLRFWAGIQPEYGYAKICENFNEEYKDKGVQVEFNRYVNNSDGNLQLETYLMGNDGIDVFIGYGNASKVLNRAQAGMLYDYSGYLKDIGFDIATELGEEAAAQCVFDGGAVYGLPTKFDNNAYLMINTDMFKAAGVPIPYEGWTYDEFKDALVKLTSGEGQNKVYGMCWGMSFTHTAWIPYVASVLGINRYFTDETCKKANLDNQVWIDGLNLIKDTMDSGVAVQLEDDIADNMTVQTEFLTGKCAIFGIFSQMRLAMDTATYPHDFTTALVPFPVPSEEYASFKTQARAAYSGDYACIASGCQYKEAACEFVRWYIQGGMNPLILGARYPLWKGNDIQDIINEVKSNAGDTIDTESLNHLFTSVTGAKYETGYTSDRESEVRDIVWEEAQDFLYGRTKTAAEAMQKAQTRADALLAG